MALSSVQSNIAANVPLPHSSRIIWTETTKPSRRYRGMSVHGTFRTSRDVRVESAMRFKADIGESSIAGCSRK